MNKLIKIVIGYLEENYASLYKSDRFEIPDCLIVKFFSVFMK